MNEVPGAGAPGGDVPAVPEPVSPVVEPAVSAAPVHDPVILTVGDIAVSRHWIVTPNGTAPLAGSTWIPRDMTTTDSKIPTWAIILAIVFALFCLVGLLFLLVKEQVTRGYFEVTVSSGSLMHTTQIPISQAAQIPQMRQLVQQAQSLAAAAAAG
jgi:hypothetical protein